jgi:hypothetical protein
VLHELVEVLTPGAMVCIGDSQGESSVDQYIRWNRNARFLQAHQKLGIHPVLFLGAHLRRRKAEAENLSSSSKPLSGAFRIDFASRENCSGLSSVLITASP